jgi:CheY-like chemotaxis protein
MNLFGNAMKYTETGYIHVSLRSSRMTENTDAPTAITLTITDTGSGMSPGFLADRIFQPFSQENPHAPGTGLGLSIVRQIIDTNGGKVEVSSDPQVGTKLMVKLALTKPEIPVTLTNERAQYLSYIPRLRGRRICILRKKIAGPTENTKVPKTDEGLLRFTNALVDTLETHFKMEVLKTTEWEGHHADIVICPELSFDYLATIRQRRTRGQRAPVTIFVGMDALEASTLRSDVRVTNRESVVEIITQPCGPYKLAYILNRCLDRYEHPAENLQPTDSSSPPTQPFSQETQQQSHPSLPMNSTQSTTESLNLESPRPAAPSTADSTTAQPSITSQNEEDPVISHTLIVDDNLLNRRLLIAFMKKYGFPFEQASNGKEALDKYKEGPHKFDVILMDMSMPVMDGMSATRAIRQHERNNNLPRCSIVALTGLASSSAKLEAWSSGIDHFMTKPINFKALGKLLRTDETRRHARLRDADDIRAAANMDPDDSRET